MPVKETIMVKLCIHVPKEQADKMHALVECGEYPADAEVYREARPKLPGTPKVNAGNLKRG